MSISFEIAKDFVLVTYTGRILEQEFLKAWQTFYKSDGWTPGLNELNDLSRADFSQISTRGIREAVDTLAGIHRCHGKSFKTAHYAPGALQFGMAKVYDALAGGSSDTTRVFQDIEEAKSWLLGLF